MACSQGYGTFVAELGVKVRTPNSQLGAYVTQNMKQLLRQERIKISC